MALWVVSTAKLPMVPGLVGHGLDVAAMETQAPVPRASARLELAASASEPPPDTSVLLSTLSDTNPPSALRLHVAGVVAAPAEDVSAQATARAAVPTAAIRIRPLIAALPLPSPHLGSLYMARNGAS